MKGDVDHKVASEATDSQAEVDKLEDAAPPAGVRTLVPRPSDSPQDPLVSRV